MTISPMWLNEQEVSKITGLSVHTLRAHRFQRRGIPYVKVGRSIRYALSDVEEFMRARTIRPEA